jgi:hypothetical protein
MPKRQHQKVLKGSGETFSKVTPEKEAIRAATTKIFRSQNPL